MENCKCITDDNQSKKDLCQHLEEHDIEVLEEKDKSKISGDDLVKATMEIGVLHCGADIPGHAVHSINMSLERILKARNKKTGNKFEIFEYVCSNKGGCSRVYISRFPLGYQG